MTWEQAESLFPGCSAEWDEMCLVGGPHRPNGPVEVRLVLSSWGQLSPADGRLVAVRCLRAVQLDPDGEWELPPEWRRWPDGSWTAPLPVTRAVARATANGMRPGLRSEPRG